MHGYSIRSISRATDEQHRNMRHKDNDGEFVQFGEICFFRNDHTDETKLESDGATECLLIKTRRQMSSFR